MNSSPRNNNRSASPQNTNTQDKGSASKFVASGDRGATGKARPQFRKGEKQKGDDGESLSPSEAPSSIKQQEQSVVRNLGSEFRVVNQVRLAEVQKPSSRWHSFVFIILGIAILIAFIGYSPSNQLPYCDSNSETEYGSTCRPCPSHGFCSMGSLVCEEGFIELGGSCVEDKRINVVAKEIRRKIDKILATRAGNIMCFQTNLSKEMDENNLLEEISASYGHKLPLDEIRFRRAFDIALNSVRIGPALQSSTVCEKSNDKLYCYSTRPSLSIYCSTKLFILRKWYKLLFYLGIISILLYLYQSFRQRRWIRKQVKLIIGEVYRQLSQNSHVTSPSSERKKFVVTRLRDDLLHDETLFKWKDIIWEKVESHINNDTRVLKSKQIVDGLPQLVWEWQDKMVT
eukprot:jgi/Galph1/5518/GphlegSOOS_G4142.1